MTDHSEPTYENQLWHANRLLKEEGIKGLRGYADVGRMCRCGTCFCCAALEVLRTASAKETD